MGGTVALTIRFSDGEEYRGACWTNILPTGLFSADFFFKEKSEAHTKAWLKNLLDYRENNPEIKKIYGSWNKLAP